MCAVAEKPHVAVSKCTAASRGHPCDSVASCFVKLKPNGKLQNQTEVVFRQLHTVLWWLDIPNCVSSYKIATMVYWCIHGQALHSTVLGGLLYTSHRPRHSSALDVISALPCAICSPVKVIDSTLTAVEHSRSLPQWSEIRCQMVCGIRHQFRLIQATAEDTEKMLLWRAYRNSPMLFRTIPFPTPFDRLFPKTGGSQTPPKTPNFFLIISTFSILGVFYCRCALQI